MYQVNDPREAVIHNLYDSLTKLAALQDLWSSEVLSDLSDLSAKYCDVIRKGGDDSGALYALSVMSFTRDFLSERYQARRAEETGENN